METPLVSVIVPIYKVEAYLDQCIQSITEQSYQNLEIILVDDGSPDKCPQICDCWAQKDNRIQVVHKVNGGLSDARNTGISLASGSYLIMPDGDDYLMPDMIETMVNYAQKYQAQCILGGYQRLWPDGTLMEHSGTDAVLICDSKQKVETCILRRLIGAEYKEIPHLNQSVGTKLYNCRLIHNGGLTFLPTKEIGCEDFLFNISFFEKVEKAVIIPENGYIYRLNNQSISTTFNSERANCLIRLYKRLKPEVVLSDTLEYQQMLAANILGGISVHIKQIVASDVSDKISKIAFLMHDETVREMLLQCRMLKIKFPLSLFCLLMKYRMKYTLFFLIRLFLKLN